MDWVFVGNQTSRDHQRTAGYEFTNVFDNETQAFGDVLSERLLGTWRRSTVDDNYVTLIFFDDGTYFHSTVDENDNAERVGIELGTYSQNTQTGRLTVTQLVDNNGDEGLTDFVGTRAPNIFVKVKGDTLTARIDEDGDAVIDKTIIFQRQ